MGFDFAVPILCCCLGMQKFIGAGGDICSAFDLSVLNGCW